MTVVEPDQHVAGGRRRNQIEIAVVIDIASDDAGDGCVETNGRGRAGELDRNMTITGTILNECRVD